MTFTILAKTYLKELQEHLRQAETTGELTPELSYRPSTDRFLRDLCGQICPEAKVIFEPKKQGEAGRPDWLIRNDKHSGIYGYIEGKPINCVKHLQTDQYDEQIERYLGLGAAVVLTDGLDFVFFGPESDNPILISLIQKPTQASELSGAIPNLDLERAFREFLEEPSFRISSEVDLIKECALRARCLSNKLKDFVEIPLLSGLTEEENSTIEALHELKEVLESHHDQTLNSSQSFADFVSQVLVFGLLYAHRVVSAPGDTPESRDSKIKQFWTDVVYSSHAEKLRPFSALISLLGDELKALGPLGTWYADCRLMLAHTDLAIGEGDEPDFHQLYEHFLDEFDKETKFDYGSFYTPRPLAQYALRASEAILRRDFPSRSFFESNNKLIDPCCGTGTFLELLVRSASKAGAFPKIAGFEILPAPYALAHYRLAMLQENEAAIEKTSVILTNTLSDELEKADAFAEAGNAATRSIIKEQKRAREISQPPLMLIIGNPPSSDSPRKGTPQHFTIIDKLIDDFRPPMENRHSRQNIQKQTQNEFMFFLRWACRKLEVDSGVSVLCFVLPNSFLEKPSYAVARQWLLGHFNGLWVLEIDADLRTGVRGENLFKTRQGRCLLIGIRKPAQDKKSAAVVRFTSVVEFSKTEKIKYLTKTASFRKIMAKYEDIDVKGPDFYFRRARGWNRHLYDAYWPLCPGGIHPDEDELFVFARHCSGLKLAPSNLLVHTKKPVLIRRSKDIASSDKDYEVLRHHWFSGQRKPPGKNKLTEAVKRALGAANGPSSVRDYSYRPFLQMYALLTSEVLSALSKTQGGGTRARPEVLSAFKKNQVVGLAVAPSPKELSDELTQFASFCWGVPDNDLSRRGNAHIFCNFFPEYKMKASDWTSEPTSNVHPELIKALGLKSTKEMPAETAVVFYCYAILCSEWYLNQFEAVLFSVHRWPRIPFPKGKKRFQSLVKLGMELADLENFSITFLPEEDRQLLIESWGDFKVVRYNLDEARGVITLQDDAGNSRTISGLEPKVLAFRVGGYQVVREWLKFHSYAYSRSTFRKEDAMELLSVCARILKHLELAKTANAVLASPSDDILADN